MRNESNSGRKFALSAGHNSSEERSECEHTCWDPKGKKTIVYFKFFYIPST